MRGLAKRSGEYILLILAQSVQLVVNLIGKAAFMAASPETAEAWGHTAFSTSAIGTNW